MRAWKWVLAISLLSATALSASGSYRETIGIARNSKAEVQYIEYHRYFETGDHAITYYSPDLTPLVEKELRYPGLAQHPEIQQRDLLNNIEITIRPENEVLTVTREQALELATWNFDLTPEVIVDAGFDGYIRQAWDGLAPNKPQILRFAIAGQGRLIAMKITDQGFIGERRVFTMEPKNWIIRMVVPKIRVEYTRDKRLARYQGLSNIRAAKDADLEPVDIVFTHSDSPEFQSLSPASVGRFLSSR